MSEVSSLRLYLLRAMYLFMALGLALVIWPSILVPVSPEANAGSVVRALLGALGLLCLLGLRYPLQMLPLLVFELLWKVIWVLATALPMWLAGGLNPYGAATLLDCSFGLVLLPLVLPWNFIWRHYVLARSTPWRLGRSAT